jgi:hypothetical protein
MNEQSSTLYQDTKKVIGGIADFFKIIAVFSLALNISIGVHFLKWFTPFLFTNTELHSVPLFAGALFHPIINIRLLILIAIVAFCYYLEWKLFVKFIRFLRAAFITVRWMIDYRGGIGLAVFASVAELERQRERYRQEIKAGSPSPAANRYLKYVRRKILAHLHKPAYLIKTLDTFPKRVYGIND